jgi:two-component system sensor histidine kinase/response regulator
MEEDIEKCRAAGMWDHIGKPIDPDELFAKLLKWIKPRQFAEVQGPSPTPPMPLKKVEKEAPKPAKQDVPEIPGLDTGLGLKRVMGKKPFYLDMLRKYIDNQGQAPVQIRESLAAGDDATAERQAHTAKGVSGNIGATGVQELAARVEKAIKTHESREVIEALIVPFAEAHARLMADLREALPAPEAAQEPDGAASPADREQGVAACRELAALLANDDSEAVDLLDQKHELLRTVLGAGPFLSIEKALKDYDFEKALQLLRDQADKSELKL